MIARSARLAVLALGLAVRLASAASDLPLTIDVDNSKGLKSGDSVVFEGKPIGRVADVGFGDRDTVEIRVMIDAPERGRVHQAGAFVVNEAVAGQRPTVEYFVIDASSPLAEPNARFEGLRSVAEVWLRRGRISADELSRAMSQGVEQFRRNLDELRRSPEWAKFKDQVAQLSAQLTATGAALTQLLSEQLPKLQKELDDLYAEYQKQLEKAQRERTPAPAP
jgi:ABC-type transporter Mla subunit MlaD